MRNAPRSKAIERAPRKVYEYVEDVPEEIKASIRDMASIGGICYADIAMLCFRDMHKNAGVKLVREIMSDNIEYMKRVAKDRALRTQHFGNLGKKYVLEDRLKEYADLHLDVVSKMLEALMDTDMIEKNPVGASTLHAHVLKCSQNIYAEYRKGQDEQKALENGDTD